ncbi:MAG: 50S ribosomal protein L13 [Candidatus Micrarchaeota archaeon]
MKVIDGDGMILGRLGAKVAKMLLCGEDVVLLNASKLVISGDRKVIVERYNTRRGLKYKANPEYSSHWPRKPDLLVKRIIRGMLPFYSRRGREAHKKLRVYSAVPLEYKDVEKTLLPFVGAGKLSKYTTIGEVCMYLGYNA